MAASARADPDEEQPPREQPHRERRNRMPPPSQRPIWSGTAGPPMANTGALFRDLRSAILAATNIGVSPRAGLLTKPAGAWSVATIKVRGSTAGRLRKAPAVTREVRFRRVRDRGHGDEMVRPPVPTDYAIRT